MKSTQASSKALKRSKTVPEQPFGVFRDAVSRVRVAKTTIPVEARSAERLATLGNIVPMDKAYVEKIRETIEGRARKFRDKIAENIISTTVGLDQALDWNLTMLRDAFKIEGSISVDIVHLLDAAANIAMLEHITASLHMTKETRVKLLEAAIHKGVEHAYANISKEKGGAGRSANPSLAGLLTDDALRRTLVRRDGRRPKR